VADYIKNTEPRAQPWRRWVQAGFLVLNIWIGFLFVRFAAQLEQGIEPTVSRPPGVEGYLPVGALVTLKNLLSNHVLSPVHPAGFVLLLLFIAIAILLKKGFCSWFCPVGMFSEYLEKLHLRLFRRRLKLPAWADWPLRMVKYILAFFFVFTIVFAMKGEKAAEFVSGDYNKVADLKMLKFFTAMTPTAATVLVILFVLSILVPYFWCRYLCPYGALLGFLSIFSPVTVRRNADSCIDCRACTKACPAVLPVHKMAQVSSDECHACLKCVDACPVADTLELKVTGREKRVPGWVYAALIVGLFVAVTGIAQLAGYWNTSVTTAEYMDLAPRLDELSHDRGM
jgi:polyferredoxin